MVCPRCIQSVQAIFDQLEIPTASVSLGEVITATKIGKRERTLLENNLAEQGFELLQDKKAQLISQIKTLILEQIRNEGRRLKVNYSDYIAESLNHEYTSLSKLFTSVEGITIERYILKQKIEYVKELLFYNELTLSQIANQMEYSSVAHLSAQFKKETGMTPSSFKKLKKPGHKALDSV